MLRTRRHGGVQPWRPARCSSPLSDTIFIFGFTRKNSLWLGVSPQSDDSRSTQVHPLEAFCAPRLPHAAPRVPHAAGAPASSHRAWRRAHDETRTHRSAPPGRPSGPVAGSSGLTCSGAGRASTSTATPTPPVSGSEDACDPNHRGLVAGLEKLPPPSMRGIRADQEPPQVGSVVGWGPPPAGLGAQVVMQSRSQARPN